MVSAKQNSCQAHGRLHPTILWILQKGCRQHLFYSSGLCLLEAAMLFCRHLMSHQEKFHADSSGNLSCSNNCFSLLATNSTMVKTHMNTLKFFQVLVKTERTQEPCLSNTPMKFLKKSKLSNKAF